MMRLLILAGAVALTSCGGSAPRAGLQPIPDQNVLLITIDTLRADALGCYGGPAATPALDRLAANGVRFDFAHAHAVTTLASHASILTGTYPFQHGIRDNSGYRLPAHARTASTLLKAGGYATAAFVAAFPLHSRFGLNQGFDLYDDRFGDTRAPDEFAMPERPASVVVPLARQWIAERHKAGEPGGPGESGQPWFVWVHLFDPHAPYSPPAPFDAPYASRPYYGEVAATDAALAPLFDDVRAMRRPTLVIVTGDHGEALGDHGEQSHGLFAYEATLRVPLIFAEVGGAVRLKPETTDAIRPTRDRADDVRGVRLQADRSRGEVSHIAARHIDILPTILEATGTTIPGDLPGRSVLTATERRDPAARASYFEAMSGVLNRGWAPLTGVLVDREKYIDLPIAERYDLAGDAAERSNLAGRSPERDRTLAATLRGFSATAPGQRQAESPDASARLHALGYVAGNAPAKTRYTEDDDPKRLVDLDQAVHDAVAAFTAGRAGDAVTIYQQVITRRPDMAIAYRHVAFVQWQQGNAAGAIDTLQRAMKAGVSDPRLQAQLGGYLTETGHPADGIRLLAPLAAAPTTDLDALNALGIAYAQAGRAADARSVFERVETINPSSSVPIENLGLLALQQGDAAQARREFERAVRVDPRSSRAHSGLGTALLKAGERSAAVAEWTRAAELDPRNFDALYNAGTTLARAGDSQAARPFLERFVRTAPPALYARDLQEASKLLAGR